MRDVIVSLLMETVRNISRDDAYRAAERITETLHLQREVIEFDKSQMKEMA